MIYGVGVGKVESMLVVWWNFWERVGIWLWSLWCFYEFYYVMYRCEWCDLGDGGDGRERDWVW